MVMLITKAVVLPPLHPLPGPETNAYAGYVGYAGGSFSVLRPLSGSETIGYACYAGRSSPAPSTLVGSASSSSPTPSPPCRVLQPMGG